MSASTLTAVDGGQNLEYDPAGFDFEAEINRITDEYIARLWGNENPSLENTPVNGVDFAAPTGLDAPIVDTPKKKMTDGRESLIRSTKTVSKRVGVIATGAVCLNMALVGLGSINSAEDAVAADNRVEIEVSTTQTTEKKPATTTTNAPTTTEVEAPTTTTTAAPEAPRFLPKPGEDVGVLTLFGCEDILVKEHSQAEDVPGNPRGIGSGFGTLDFLTPDLTPNIGQCETINNREQELESITGVNYIDRSERTRESLINNLLPNPNGNVSLYQPIAGHSTSMEYPDKYVSVLPGEAGNSVIDAHGSTFNAAFADLGLLKSGDLVPFARADGRNFVFEVVEYEIVSDSDFFGEIRDYSHPDNESTLSIFMCVDEDGNTGKATNRYVVRLVLRSSS